MSILRTVGMDADEEMGKVLESNNVSGTGVGSSNSPMFSAPAAQAIHYPTQQPQMSMPSTSIDSAAGQNRPQRQRSRVEIEIRDEVMMQEAGSGGRAGRGSVNTRFAGESGRRKEQQEDAGVMKATQKGKDADRGERDGGKTKGVLQTQEGKRFEDNVKGVKDVAPRTDGEGIVQLNNLHKTYLLGLEGVAALRGISLSIQRSEWVAIYGTSGGGKTSLLNLVGTIDKPTKGELKVCGTVINPSTPDDVLAGLRLSKLGFVFQTFNLLSSMTALENVELPMILKGELTPSERRNRAKSSLERVGLAHRLHQYCNKLSGGEQQRVTIARAIANKPELLLLDEPTGDLDTINTYKVIQLLSQLNRDLSMTMLMVTHDVYLKNFCHKVVYLRDGKLSKVEMVPAERREMALRDLEAKLKQMTSIAAVATLKQPHQIPTIKNSTNAPGTNPNAPLTSESSTTVLGASSGIPPTGCGRIETGVEEDGAAGGKAGNAGPLKIGMHTYVREPGDYETYTPKTEAARKSLNEFLLKTVSLLNVPPLDIALESHVKGNRFGALSSSDETSTCKIVKGSTILHQHASVPQMTPTSTSLLPTPLTNPAKSATPP
ncbi:ABC transporter AbcH.1 [Quaeritorhiza haematococci]|nr:ABC transporter AbcH.1 [Quaeritorhiza haematococci]